jgi:hypothetical protein
MPMRKPITSGPTRRSRRIRFAFACRGIARRSIDGIRFLIGERLGWTIQASGYSVFRV